MIETEAVSQPPADTERNVTVGESAAPSDVGISETADLKSGAINRSDEAKSDSDKQTPDSPLTDPSPEPSSPPPILHSSINTQAPRDSFIASEVRGDAIKEVNSAQGDLIKHIEKLFNLSVNFGSHELQPLREFWSKAADTPVLELTDDLSPRTLDISWLEPSVVKAFSEALKTDRQLFVICPDKQIARASAWAIIEQIDPAGALQKRLLDLGRTAREASNPSIFYLRRSKEKEESVDEDEDILIVVDAIDTTLEAQDFLRVIIDTGSDDVIHKLRSDRIMMICLVESVCIQAHLRSTVEGKTRPREFLFSRWDMPFLRAVLKPYFEANYLELEKKLLAQRSDWDPDDKIFLSAIQGLLKTESLRAQMESPRAELPAAETLFSGEDPIGDSVVYAASFFKHLTPREFQYVVNTLFGDRTKTITASVLKEKVDGSSERVEIEYERPLVEIWQESMDKFKRQCQLRTVPGRDGSRTVDFNDHRLRARMSRYLEDEYPFFFTSQFERLLRAGLLFDPSPQIGENMLKLTAAVAASDPDYYGKVWLIKIIGEFEDVLSTGSLEDQSLPTFFKALAGLDDSPANQLVYQRITRLIRIMLETYDLAEPVYDLLDKLMRQKLYKSVQKIVPRLKFVAGFDEFYWLKQLFDRGDRDARWDASLYLYKYLRRSGPRVYEILSALDPWLPNEGATDHSPSASGKEALRMMVFYCIETTASIEPHHYGAWPSRHPLFAFRDIESAENNLKLLGRWLFHPWMQSAFPDDSDPVRVDELIATLVLEWIFILIGPSARLAASPEKDQSAIAVSAVEAERILAEQVVASANVEQQADLLAFWQIGSRDMFNQIQKLSYVSEVRDELIWKRNLLDEVITQFRDLVEASQKFCRVTSD